MEVSRLIHERVARRLEFIRYLYGEAERQAEQSEPMCVASVLTSLALTHNLSLTRTQYLQQ